MRFKLLIGVFFLIFFMGCNSTTALTSTETTGCEAQPGSLPPGPSASLDPVAREMDEESGAALVSTRSLRPNRYEETSHTILVAALALAAVIFALYSFTGDALDCIRRARVRWSQNISSAPPAEGSVSSPPTTPGISDISERLQIDEVDEQPPPYSHQGASLPKDMRERRSVYSTAKLIEVRRTGARRGIAVVPNDAAVDEDADGLLDHRETQKKLFARLKGHNDP
jgi:hypothetical protein